MDKNEILQYVRDLQAAAGAFFFNKTEKLN